MSCQVWLIHCHTFNLSQGATCAYTHSLSVHQIVLLESVYLSALSVDLADNLPRCPEDTHHQTTTLLFCPQMALPLMYCPPISRSDDYFDQAPGELPLLVLRLSGSLKMPLPNYSCTLIFGNLTGACLSSLLQPFLVYLPTALVPSEMASLGTSLGSTSLLVTIARLLCSLSCCTCRQPW